MCYTTRINSKKGGEKVIYSCYKQIKFVLILEH